MTLEKHFNQTVKMQISDDFVRQHLDDLNIEQLISFDEKKPWGAWWLFETGIHPTTQEEYDKKILKVSPSDDLRMLSLQFHGQADLSGHREIWRAVTDIVLLLGKRNVVGLEQTKLEEAIAEMECLKLKSGEEVEIPEGYLHALVNPWQNRPIYVEETRLSPANSQQTYQVREANIVRIFDQSGRDGLSDFPDFWKERLRALR